jgi:GNAT superfamily N-acetyltransferase
MLRVMLPILHLRKQLVHPPAVRFADAIDVRHMVLPDDIAAWLALRERAMKGQTPQVRPWTQEDFLGEMAQTAWWRSDWTWLAIADRVAGTDLAGAVSLAVREGRSTSVPIIHWLLVDPACRRRGIGHLLVSHLERAAWDAGWREVQLETHAGWAEAVAFYHSIGYAPVRDRSPR